MPVLDKVTHVCLISVSLVALYVLIDQRMVRSRQEPRRSTPSDFIGRRLDFPEISWSTQRRSVVLAISSHCRYCIHSTPLYRSLGSAAAAKSGRGNGALVVVTFEPVETMEAFLAQQGIVATKVLHVDFDSLRVRSTPTLLLVDAQGKVVDAFVGLVPPGKTDIPIKFLQGG